MSSAVPTEADQQVKESPAETQTSEAPAENPAGPPDEDVNDGDPMASTKTSVETLNDVLNENNSNNNRGTVNKHIQKVRRSLNSLVCKHLACDTDGIVGVKAKIKRIFNVTFGLSSLSFQQRVMLVCASSRSA